MTKLESLLKRKEKLEDKLYETKLKENAQCESIGWGYAMKRVKLPSFNKSTRIRNKIEEIDILIKELKSNENNVQIS